MSSTGSDYGQRELFSDSVFPNDGLAHDGTSFGNEILGLSTIQGNLVGMSDEQLAWCLAVTDATSELIQAELNKRSKARILTELLEKAGNLGEGVDEDPSANASSQLKSTPEELGVVLSLVPNLDNNGETAESTSIQQTEFDPLAIMRDFVLSQPFGTRLRRRDFIRNTSLKAVDRSEAHDSFRHKKDDLIAEGLIKPKGDGVHRIYLVAHREGNTEVPAIPEISVEQFIEALLTATDHELTNKDFSDRLGGATPKQLNRFKFSHLADINARLATHGLELLTYGPLQTRRYRAIPAGTTPQFMADIERSTQERLAMALEQERARKELIASMIPGLYEHLSGLHYFSLTEVRAYFKEHGIRLAQLDYYSIVCPGIESIAFDRGAEVEPIQIKRMSGLRKHIKRPATGI